MNKRDTVIAEIPRLRRFARALVGDPAAADDLVQDCLERALGRLHLWRAGTNMRAWLFTILRNLHFNQMRQSARRPASSPLVGDHDPALGVGPSQEQGLAVSDLGQALELLPAEQREIILLIGLEGMSYKQTAKILDVPVGTVMSRLSRGREALRSLLDGGGHDIKPSLRRVK